MSEPRSNSQVDQPARLQAHQLARPSRKKPGSSPPAAMTAEQLDLQMWGWAWMMTY